MKESGRGRERGREEVGEAKVEAKVIEAEEVPRMIISSILMSIFMNHDSSAVNMQLQFWKFDL